MAVRSDSARPADVDCVQATAVALKSGASANAKFKDGVAVFTSAKGGLMFEASLGGQKFKFEPF